MNSGNCEDGQDQVKKGDKNSAITTEPAVFKRPRIETPSPLPTFKVRKKIFYFLFLYFVYFKSYSLYWECELLLLFVSPSL